MPPPPPPEPVASPEPGQPVQQTAAGAAPAARLGTPRAPGRSASGEAARQPSQSAEERRHRPLPEAAFSEDDDYQLDDAPPMPTNYIRSVELRMLPLVVQVLFWCRVEQMHIASLVTPACSIKC